MHEDIRERLTRFVVEAFLYGKPQDLPPPHASLSAQRVVDSTGFLELVDHLGTEFGLEVPDADLVPGNFDTLDALVAYVARRLDGPGP